MRPIRSRERDETQLPTSTVWRSLPLCHWMVNSHLVQTPRKSFIGIWLNRMYGTVPPKLWHGLHQEHGARHQAASFKMLPSLVAAMHGVEPLNLGAQCSGRVLENDYFWHSSEVRVAAQIKDFCAKLPYRRRLPRA